MAEEFHIIDFPETNHIDAKEFSRIAKNAAELTEDYSFHASLDALSTMISIAENFPTATSAQSSPIEQANAIAADTLGQASLMIDEVKRFKTLSNKITNHS